MTDAAHDAGLEIEWVLTADDERASHAQTVRWVGALGIASLASASVSIWAWTRGGDGLFFWPALLAAGFAWLPVRWGVGGLRARDARADSNGRLAYRSASPPGRLRFDDAGIEGFAVEHIRASWEQVNNVRVDARFVDVVYRAPGEKSLRLVRIPVRAFADGRMEQFKALVAIARSRFTAIRIGG